MSGFASRFQHSLTRVLRNFFGFFGQGHRPPSPNVPIRLWTYLPVCLCLFVCLRTCLSICLPVSQSVSQSVCLSVCLSPCLPNYLPYTTYLPVPEKPFISDAFRETCKIRVKKRCPRIFAFILYLLSRDVTMFNALHIIADVFKQHLSKCLLNLNRRIC